MLADNIGEGDGSIICYADWLRKGPLRKEFLMELKQIKVGVLNGDGTPLMPTNLGKAWKLIRKGKAKLIRRSPMVIRLNYQIENPGMQKVKLGIDDGGINVGLAFVSNHKVLASANVQVSKNVKFKDPKTGKTIDADELRKKMFNRAMFRRGRRGRKTRYRKCRFSNRGSMIGKCKVCGGNAPKSDRKTGGRAKLCRKCATEGHFRFADTQKEYFRIPPSIKRKKDRVLRVVERFCFPVDEIVYESAYFDTQKLENPDIKGEEYQQGDQLGYRNFKMAVKVRDDFTCQLCKDKNKKPIDVHHIIPRRNGGTDRVSNGITLCDECHDSIKGRESEYVKKFQKLTGKSQQNFKSAAHTQTGKDYLVYKLSEIAPIKKTFGYITSWHRAKSELPKDHYIDACIIADKYLKEAPKEFYRVRIIPRGTYRRMQDSQPIKGQIFRPNEVNKEMNGFRKYDLVRALLPKGRGIEYGYITALFSNGALKIGNLEGIPFIKGISWKRCKKLSDRRTVICEATKNT